MNCSLVEFVKLLETGIGRDENENTVKSSQVVIGFPEVRLLPINDNEDAIPK